MRTPILGLLALAVGVGCGEELAEPLPPDAGMLVDASANDAGPLDARPMPDADADAGQDDASVPADGGTEAGIDAGPPPACPTTLPGRGQVSYGTDAYIKYVQGDLPIIMGAPHGGALRPDGLTDRTEGVLGGDTNSRHVTYEVAQHIMRLTGHYPFLVINRLHRRKLDANREIVEAAQGDRAAEQAWAEFHEFIDGAKSDVTEACGRGLYLDMHTNNHAGQWTEIGALVRGSELESSDEDLQSYAETSSVRNLSQTYTLAEILRGRNAIGSRLQALGYSAVPSEAIPHPMGQDFFRGGYNTGRHGSIRQGSVDALQIENFLDFLEPGVRNGYAEALARAIVDFYEAHYDLQLIDPQWQPPMHQRCAQARALVLTQGAVTVADSTIGATDEFGEAVTCGTGFWLDGPQVYFTFEAEAGASYDIGLAPSFGARIMLFGDTCDPAQVQAQCQNGAIPGELVSQNTSASFTFVAATAGLQTIAVDSRAYAWYGDFELSIVRR